jgi:hypothetical protein
MINPDPIWTFDARRRLTDWYDHVELLPNHVLGQWFCAERATGRRLWERGFIRPNNVVGIADGVIVASEMRSDGPWTAGFGCYGISLETGRLLWTSHGEGGWDRFVRMLDFVPGFTNELRDAPVEETGGRCRCGSGRVLDVRTGRTVRPLSKEEACAERPEVMTDACRLYSTPALEVRTGVWPSSETRKRGPEGWFW